MLEYVTVFPSDKKKEDELRNEIGKFKKDCRIYTKTYLLEKDNPYFALESSIEITQLFVEIENDSKEYSDIVERLEELKFFKMPKDNPPSFRIRKLGKDDEIGILD